MTDEQNNRLKWALRFAKEGFRVHLLPPNSKIPEAGSEWKKDATCNPVVIRALLADNGPRQRVVA